MLYCLNTSLQDFMTIFAPLLLNFRHYHCFLVVPSYSVMFSFTLSACLLFNNKWFDCEKVKCTFDK